VPVQVICGLVLRIVEQRCHQATIAVGLARLEEDVTASGLEEHPRRG
jgi:hypothetical protein